jgi:hypothetical protein
MGVLDFIAGIFKPISDVIDHVLPSGDAKIQLQQVVIQGQIQAAEQMMDYQRQLLSAQSDIVKAEATGNSWLQRNWRPMTALFLVICVGMYWFGYGPKNLTQSSVDDMFGLVKICLGGYVAGRSAEKIAPSIATAIKAAKSPIQ